MLFISLMKRRVEIIKFHNPKGLYFVSFAVLSWLDVFTPNEYKDLYCHYNKPIELWSN